MHTKLLEARATTTTLKQQTKTSPYLSFIWYMVGLPVVLLVPAWATWGQFTFPIEATTMTFLCSLIYVATIINQHEVNHFQSYKSIGLSAFYITVGFVILLSFLAGFRMYYSRSFLTSSYFLNLAWFGAGMLMSSKAPPELLVIKGGLADSLSAYSKKGWHFSSGITNGLEISRFDGIAVDLHAHDDRRLLKGLADSSLHGIPLMHAASVYEQYSGRTPVDYLAHEGLFELSAGKPYRFFKRFWEITFVSLVSLLSLPVMALVAVMVKLESTGPVFFTQKRIGKDGEPFTLYKFRSMIIDSENHGPQFAQKDDQRITTFGRFIRKYRIDELPQFWNVIKGDMSLIGPRPEQPAFVSFFEEEIPFYAYRHSVRPGITGWAQILGGYAADIEATTEKLEYDLYYVKNFSFSLDVLIVYATIKTVLTGFGSR